MRFILRSQEKQARLEGRSEDHSRTDDYAVVIDGPVVGRIYRYLHGPAQGQWGWFLQKPTGANGMSETLDAAKEALRQRWFQETQRLSRE